MKDANITMVKTRVVFFADILTPGHDGAVRTMYQLISRIDKRAFEYLFIYGTGPDEIAGFESVKVPAFTVPVNRSYKMAFPALVQNSLRDRLAVFKPDVVHIATPSLLGEFALKYAGEQRLPAISIYHTHFISYIDYYLKSAPFLIDFVRAKVAEGQKTFYNRCSLVYVPSETMAAELAGIGVSASKMKIWKRGMDTSVFSPAKRDAALMRNLTGNDKPVILFASRLVWEKNLETLIRIYDLLLLKNMPFNMVIAGDGVARNVCEARMDRALFTGKIDHEMLAALYASADVFVFPSVSETYGNVVLEAMASGLPCVIANGGGSADFIEQGINGFKCDPYNEHDYVEKITLLLDSAPLQKQFTGTGLQYSRQFDWGQLADTYFTDIQKLAQPEVMPAAC